MDSSIYDNLFKKDDEPMLLTFALPDIDDDEEIIELSAAQLKRLLGLVSIIIASECQFKQIILPHENGRLETIAFSVTGKTAKLKRILDGILPRASNNEDTDSYYRPE